MRLKQYIKVWEAKKTKPDYCYTCKKKFKEPEYEKDSKGIKFDVCPYCGSDYIG